MKKLVIITTFVWIGFVCAISFMEAWLKFQAPNITIKLGLGIGKLVFTALNKVEITFAILIIIALSVSIIRTQITYLSYALTIAITILILQTFWLLPTLNEHATQIIQDIDVPKSNLHFLFVLFEIVKIICLASFGIKVFNINENKSKQFI